MGFGPPRLLDRIRLRWRLGKNADYDAPDYVRVRCIRASELRNWESEHGSTAALRKIKKSSLASRELRDGDIVILRDDGLSYGDYVEQLTYLLFLKMAHERTQLLGNQLRLFPRLMTGRASWIKMAMTWRSTTGKR